MSGAIVCVAVGLNGRVDHRSAALPLPWQPSDDWDGTNGGVAPPVSAGAGPQAPHSWSTVRAHARALAESF